MPTLGEAVVSIRADSSDLEKGLQSAEKSTDDFADQAEDNFSRVQGGLDAIADGAKKVAKIGAISFGGLAAGIVTSLRATTDHEDAMVRLNSVIEGTGKQIDALALEEYADELQGITAYSNEAALETMRMFAMYGLAEDEIKGLTRSTMNLSEILDRDLTTMSIRVARSIEEGATSLTRYGITMTEAEQQAFDMADQQERVNILMDVFGRHTGPAAERMADTLTGQWRRMINAVDDLAKEFGRLFTGDVQDRLADVRQIVVAITNAMINLDDDQRSAIANMILLGTAISGTVTAGSLMIILFATLVKSISILIGALALLKSPLIILMVLVGILAKTWSDNWDEIADATSGVYNEHIKPVVDNILGKLDEFIQWFRDTNIGKAVEEFFNDLVKVWENEDLTFREKLEKTFGITLDLVLDGINFIGENAIPTLLGGAIAAVVAGLVFSSAGAAGLGFVLGMFIASKLEIDFEVVKDNFETIRDWLNDKWKQLGMDEPGMPTISGNTEAGGGGGGAGGATPVSLSEQDKKDIALMTQLEAGGERFEGQQAVAEVIINRVLSEEFPNTVRGVISQDKQFEPFADIESWDEWDNLINSNDNLGTQLEAVEKALTSNITEGALFFVNPDIVSQRIREGQTTTHPLMTGEGTTTPRLESPVPGYQDGGLTSGGVNQPAGVVHGGEWVMPAWMVDKYPALTSMLEGMRNGYQAGGGVNIPGLSSARETLANADTTLSGVTSVVTNMFEGLFDSMLDMLRDRFGGEEWFTAMESFISDVRSQLGEETLDQSPRAGVPSAPQEASKFSRALQIARDGLSYLGQTIVNADGRLSAMKEGIMAATSPLGMLASVITTLLPDTEAFESIMSAIRPVLEAVTQIISDILAPAFGFLADVLIGFWNGLMDLISMIPFVNMDKYKVSLEETTEAQEEATNAMRNLPEGVKIAQRAFEVAIPNMSVGTANISPSATNVKGNNQQIVFNGDVYGMDDFERKVRQANDRGRKSSGLNRRGLQGAGN